jgi:RHS repeat-associated protein
VRIVEKDNSVVIGDRRFVWCGTAICEERDGTGSAVTRRFYDRGLQDGALALFATMDHLDSTRELTDGTGALRARYAYDPFGKATKLSGDRDAVFLFTGHLSQSNGGLLLTHYRAYDPGVGRWISRDPLDTRQSPFPYWSSPEVRWDQPGNMYAYVNNEPTLFVDPDGRAAAAAAAAAGAWVLLCGLGSWGYGKWELSKNGPKPPGDPSNSQQTHCRAACRFNRCLLGMLPGVVLAAQYAYEYWKPRCDSDADDRGAEYGVSVSFGGTGSDSCADLCNTCNLPKDPCS